MNIVLALRRLWGGNPYSLVPSQVTATPTSGAQKGPRLGGIELKPLPLHCGASSITQGWIQIFCT